MKIQKVLALAAVLSFAFNAYPGDDTFQELKDVSERIQISNLINALSLDDGQMKMVYNSALAARKMRADAGNEIEKYYGDFLGAYGKLESEVEQGRVVVEKDTAKDFHEAKEKIDDIKNRLDKDLDRVAAQIRKSFAEHQILALNSFTPCLVPRIQEGRIGQEGSHKGLVKVLEKVRSLPADAYAQRKSAIIDRGAEKLQKKLPYLGQKEINDYKKLMAQTFDKIRGMSDVDFSINKEQIAEKIKGGLQPRKKELPDEMKIKRFLLSDQTVEVIEKMRARAVNSLAKVVNQ